MISIGRQQSWKYSLFKSHKSSTSHYVTTHQKKKANFDILYVRCWLGIATYNTVRQPSTFVFFINTITISNFNRKSPILIRPIILFVEISLSCALFVISFRSKISDHLLLFNKKKYKRLSQIYMKAEQISNSFLIC